MLWFIWLNDCFLSCEFLKVDRLLSTALIIPRHLPLAEG